MKWYVICYNIKNGSFAKSSKITVKKETSKMIHGERRLIINDSYEGIVTINKNKRNLVCISVSTEGNGNYKNSIALYKVVVKAEDEQEAFEIGKELIKKSMQESALLLSKSSYSDEFAKE